MTRVASPARRADPDEDLPRAAEFYRAIGFEEVFRTPADGQPILIAWAKDPDGHLIQIVQHTR